MMIVMMKMRYQMRKIVLRAVMLRTTQFLKTTLMGISDCFEAQQVRLLSVEILTSLD